MTPQIPRVEATTSDLFQRMEMGGIRYAFLRNYEMFPRFRSDIDLVMDARDVATWRRLAVAVAQDHGWDALTECDHWARSPARHHRIETFRFYDVADNTCLPIDLFHGLLLWGLPVFNEEELLAGRVRDGTGGFTKIDPMIENLERILQIYDLHRKGISGDKVARYRRKVVDFCTDTDAPLRQLAQRRLGPSGPEAIDDLKRDDMSRFLRSVYRGKRYFLWRYGIRQPASALRYVLARAMEYRRLYLSRQCGFVLRTHTANDRERQTLSEALDSIVAANGLLAWTSRHGERSHVSWDEHRVMERGGLVVKWVDAASKADLTIGSGESMQDIQARVAGLLIGRHQALYLKPGGTGGTSIGDRMRHEHTAKALSLEPRR